MYIKVKHGTMLKMNKQDKSCTKVCFQQTRMFPAYSFIERKA